jgi:hypothetical protein
MTPDQPRKLALAFTPQVVEYLCNVIGQRPYAEVAGLLADIQQQLQQQQPDPAGFPGAPAGLNGHDPAVSRAS